MEQNIVEIRVQREEDEVGFVEVEERDHSNGELEASSLRPLEIGDLFARWRATYSIHSSVEMIIPNSSDRADVPLIEYGS